MYLSIWGSKIKLTTLQGFPKVEFLDKKWRFGTACSIKETFSNKELFVYATNQTCLNHLLNVSNHYGI